MSYARFSDDSDVYVYRTTIREDGIPVEAWHCCACSYSDDDGIFTATPRTMADHLKMHRLGGDQVPDDAIADLMAGVLR